MFAEDDGGELRGFRCDCSYVISGLFNKKTGMCMCTFVYCTILLTKRNKLRKENNDKNRAVIIFMKIKREIKIKTRKTEVV